MKIVIEYDEETGHAKRAWAFPDSDRTVAGRFFAYARNTMRLDCEMVDAEDPVEQLLAWLLRQPAEDEQEAFAYWHEGAPPGRSVDTIHLPAIPEERAAADIIIGKATTGKATVAQDGDTGDPVNG